MSTALSTLITKTSERTANKLFAQAEKLERFRVKYGDEHPRTLFQKSKLEKFQAKLGHLTGYNL